MFCPTCRDEFREGFTWCRDCNASLVESLPPEPVETRIEEADEAPEVVPGQALVTVGRYFSPIEAQARRMTLEQAGIPAWLSDEIIGATYGVGIGSGLQVSAHDEAAARAILDSEPVEPPGLDDLALATEPTTEEPPKPEPQFESSTQSVTSSGLDKLELTSVLLVTSAYPILWNLLLSEPAGPPVNRGQMAVGAVWLGGLTCLVWILLRRGGGALAPKPLPATFSDWRLEIFLGVILFVVWYVFEASLDALLRAMGVRSGPTHWDAFFRQPGVATVFSLTALVAAAYEEVVFRAYLLSRLSRAFGNRTWWAVLASAALFALMHGYPLRPALLVLAHGVFFAVVYLTSRSLPRLVVAHWLFNLTVMSQHLRVT